MSKNDQQLEIKALGRPVQLGQLYDASKSLFRNEFLFKRKDADATVKTIPKKSTDFEYKEVKSLEDRANTLEISASLSVSILSGTVSIGGYGSFLDRKDESTQSTTIAAVARIRTEHKYLDTQGLHDVVRLEDEDIEFIGATHVVTGITYGGNAVGNITEKKTKTDSQREIKGSFSLEAFKDMAKAFTAKGKAELTDTEKKVIDKYNVNVSYMTDFEVKDPLPSKATDLIDLIKRSQEFVGTEGVPCDIVLTPLSRFNKFNAISKFRELEDADLKTLTDFFNQVINLQVNRRALFRQLDNEYKPFFPTLREECIRREEAVDKLVSDARKALRKFLETYRSESGDEDTTVNNFMKTNGPKFDGEQKLYERDSAVFEDLVEKRRAADEHKFKLLPVHSLHAELNREDNATVALVLVPERVGFISLLNMYRLFAGVVKKWQEGTPTVKKTDGSNVPTVYYSLYIDPKIVEEFQKLDSDKRTLLVALETIKKTMEPAFLTFGVSRSGGYVRELEWNILNHEGWGVLTNRKEGWRYIGAVQNKRQHGVGTVTYCDGTTYHGDWVQGQRDGYGKLAKTADPNQVIAEGVFIENRLRQDGVVLETRVYKNYNIIDYAPIALRNGDGISSHISKVAKVFGFTIGDEYKINLKTASGTMSVRANGFLIHPSEAPGIGSSFWPLDAAKEIDIERLN